MIRRFLNWYRDRRITAAQASVASLEKACEELGIEYHESLETARMRLNELLKAKRP